jgi:hypothetical protein
VRPAAAAGRRADRGDILSPERALLRKDEALGFIIAGGEVSLGAGLGICSPAHLLELD